MKKILVPTDFSKISVNALEVAVDIAKKASSEIIVLHVVEAVTEDSYSVTENGAPKRIGKTNYSP